MSVSLVAACESDVIGLKPHPAQRDLVEAIEQNPIVVCAAGRRFGKSRAAAAGALWNLLLCPELDALVAPGEKRHAVCVANSQTQARIFLEHALSLVRSSPLLAEELVGETSTALEFRGGRVLAAFPASARSARGWPISYLVLDEFAHAIDIDEGGPATMERLWSSLTPSVAQFGVGGRVVVCSTPFGSSGLFADLYAKARNGEIDGAVAFHAPTSANPMIDPSYLSAQESALGHDDFAREFGAEFVAGGSSFLETSRIRDVVADWRELLPADVLAPIAAFDPAFGRDPAALAIVGRDASDPSRLVVAWTGRWLPPKRKKRSAYRTRAETETVMAEVFDQVADIAIRYRARVVSDQHLPGTVIEELRDRGVPASIRAWSARSRDEALSALRARIYTERILLPDDPQLIAELGRFRTKYRSGASTVEVPRTGDSHCDLAIAVALGVLEVERHGAAPGRASRSTLRPDLVRSWAIHRGDISAGVS